MLAELTKMVLEVSLEESRTRTSATASMIHAGRDGGNSRNGRRLGSVLTSVGPVQIDVPSDRDGSFEPQIVCKRQRPWMGSTGSCCLFPRGPHDRRDLGLPEVYGASVSKDTISAITDRVLDAMAEWQARLLDPVYPVVFVDAVRAKIRDGNVINRPTFLAMGVADVGERDILGLWAGEHGDGEGAKFLAPRAHRAEEPQCARRAHARLRRPQGSARCRKRGLLTFARSGAELTSRSYVDVADVVEHVVGLVTARRHVAAAGLGAIQFDTHTVGRLS
ncbi:MAG TPA: transposase [Jiangellales bacterium]|nr:transposase [Jiangellales bacterium]